MFVKLKASVQVTALAGYFPTAVLAVVMEEVPLRHEGIDNEVLTVRFPFNYLVPPALAGMRSSPHVVLQPVTDRSFMLPG